MSNNIMLLRILLVCAVGAAGESDEPTSPNLNVRKY